MRSQAITDKIRDHLRSPATRMRLNERFSAARNQLTTPIGEATRLADITAEKARYAEMIGILSPGRSREGSSDDSKGSAHRRFSLRELNRLIIVGDLVAHGFSMSDIASYLLLERSTTEIMLDSIQAPDLATRLRRAEAAYLQRMLVPRLLYFAQCLLLGDVVDCSIALVLPVRDAEDPSSAVPHPPVQVTHADDLPLAGPSLVGWHSRSHPYCVLYMREPRMDDATRYVLRSVDEMCRDAGIASGCYQPTGAYLLIEPEFAHLLRATPATRARSEGETPVGESEGEKSRHAYAVAYRLLRFLQAPSDAGEGEGEGEDEFSFGRYASVGEGMVYSSPEFMSDMTGDRLLTEIAELVVRLGNAVNTEASSQRGRWIFSAILMPDNFYLPPGKQSLVVMAQSKKSPHTVGVTRVTPGKNDGLSTLAALSGHVLYRRAFDSTDAAVADAGFEGEPGPALALPVLGSHGKPLAVLYIRSKYDGDTSTSQTFTVEDQMLLRVIGHIIGGIVSGYRGNYLARDELVEMIRQPRSVDRFFHEFKSANAFWQDLEHVLTEQQATVRSAKEPRKGAAGQASRATNPITMIAIDIDGYSDYFNKYGNNTARSLLLAVGRRIADQPLLANSPLLSASDRTRKTLYHMYGDRFCLLLENVSADDAARYATNLGELLNSAYTLEVSRATGMRSGPATKFTIRDVEVRIALISYDSETLRMLLAPVDPAKATDRIHEPVQYVISVITNAIDAGLNQGKQFGPRAIVHLDMASRIFRRL